MKISLRLGSALVSAGIVEGHISAKADCMYCRFLNLLARGKFTVDLGANRGCTSLSYGGKTATQWPDCIEHPEDWHAPVPGKCLVDNPDGKGGAMHTQNYTTTAGTAFAISYQSDIRKVTMENLVVFSVVEQYMQNFKCNVTNAVSTKRLGIAKPPVACRDDSKKCVAGPKQLIAWNQAEGNNVQDVGYSPGYNARMGFKPGAQNDIFF
ncbi:hypothetical protein CTAM01_11416 [Colletotrichum tamarilloi]|uniref:Uncharacterized protein n=1 Tax=Colletotrichum tamarilloi TaxID=1209934 RepID=A0ABQ9QXI1_9PEZI|nr:uncharacterized protein CTAM01_11416 [Colletotrichum tamarilloi]KAK1488193.1 hypothetical protein CTAM01_11416 [Colletotrichum tamarilloi]